MAQSVLLDGLKCVQSTNQGLNIREGRQGRDQKKHGLKLKTKPGKKYNLKNANHVV